MTSKYNKFKEIYLCTSQLNCQRQKQIAEVRSHGRYSYHNKKFKILLTQNFNFFKKGEIKAFQDKQKLQVCHNVPAL